MVKIVIGLVVMAAVAGFFLMRNSPNEDIKMMDTMEMAGEKVVNQTEQALEKSINPAIEGAKKAGATVQEFTMTSYYDDKGAWFSLKEMKVKQGDIVRVKVTNTKGTHDWVLDEFGIKQETPANEEVVIEFVADKAGTYEYYCSKPGHRARGQWGKLIVE